MRSLPHPPREGIELTHVLHALSDPARLEIVRILDRNGESSCGLFGPGLTRATMSHHFRVLREAGVTTTRIQGREHWIGLRKADLDACFPGLLDAVLQNTRGQLKGKKE